MKKRVDNILLYHGSTLRVEEPLCHVGRKELDFGPGFYLTSDREQAISWAKTKSGRIRGSKAILNVYKFDLDDFYSSPKYRKTVFSSYNLQWLDFIAQSRKGQSPWAGNDWIEGGIANDSVITTVDAYIDGLINAEQAIGKLVDESLRNQICILNQEIIDEYLRFIESIELPD